MPSSVLVTAAISAGIPLLVLAVTFGRLLERVDQFRDLMKEAIDDMRAHRERTDRLLGHHGERITSLEAWRESLREDR